MVCFATSTDIFLMRRLMVSSYKGATANLLSTASPHNILAISMTAGLIN